MTRRGAAILCGGRGERMGGADKGNLVVGGQSVIDRLAGKLAGHDEVLLSVDRPGRYPGLNLLEVVDAVAGAGPLGGIVSCLRACRSDALLAVAADMPLFAAGLGEYLWAFFDSGCDAAVAVDRTGRRHPLCAVYGKTALPMLEEQLAAGNFRLRDALARLRVREVPLAHSAYPDDALANINTPGDLRRVSGPMVVAVCGAKNSGKTTLLTGVIPRLVARGLRVGAIKHDGHDFVPDVPGTDSFRLRESGAMRTAVFSATQYLMHAACDSPSWETLLPHFRDVDLVLLEGGKHSPFPKIEVLRRANGNAPVSGGGLLALCTDTNFAPPDTPLFGLDDHDGLAALLYGLCVPEDGRA